MSALPHDLSMATPGSKRAAAIRSDELAHGSTAYKPPAMRSGPRGAGLATAFPDQGTPADASRVSGGTAKYDASYRRARAGTLPTDLGESNRVAPPALGDYLSNRAVGSTAAYTSRSGATTPIDEAHQASARSAFALPPRPGLRHAASSSVALLSSEAAANRIRSGSLTLPSEDVGKAFGSSAFSSAWLANPGLSSGSASRKGLHKFMSSTSSNAEDSKSASSNDVTPGDELGNFSTLDYLGLEAVDTPKQASFFPPASMTDLRSQAQQNIAANGPSSRHRASTVSAMSRPAYKSSSSYSDLIAAATDERGRLHGGEDYSGYQYTDSGISSDDAYNMGMAVPKGFKDEGLLNALSSRPRATTIGMLDGKPRGMRGSSAFQSGLGGVSQASREQTGTYQRNDKEFAAMHRPIAPRHGLSASISSRTSTPDVAGRERDSAASQGQLPTRSLWLGNLDVTTTAQELMAVFAPYGAIESLRLLPEKSCAFVNFIDKADAVRAKDDVLIRLGGHIRELSDTPVRVGFGKIDSVPTAAPTASTMQYSLSNSSLSSLASGLSENGDPHSPKKEKATKLPASSASPELLDQPTRALWIGSIPANTTPGTLLSIFSPFGAVESARVLTNKQCGFVNFETIPSAIAARTALNGREILGSDVGAVKIGFAKIPVKGSPTTESSGLDGSDRKEANLLSALKDLKGRAGLGEAAAGGMENYSSNLVMDLLQKGVHDDVKAFKRPPSVAGSATSSTRELASENGITEQQMIMMVLSDGDASMEEDVLAVANEGDPDHPALYYSYIPAMGERHQMRRFDAMALKELRKRLDSGALEQHEVDQIATDLLDDCVDLSSDYIGNCLIQRLFEQENPDLRLAMLERIAPHLALIGTHKNGTWAAQKIIECSNTPTELAIISQNLQPYCPPLCADQFGNYVVSMCLRFGEPSNHFIFNAMVDRVWDIAQTRFGARCMRTCLESTHTTHFQKKRIAAAIVLHSIPLATNPNGALLLTWLVDASELPGRYSLLAPRFAPYLPHLATHKLASLTILRIVNQKAEPEAATTILDAMFKSPEDRVLQEILQDQVHGCHTVAKIVTGGGLPAHDKAEYVEACKRVLSNMRVSSSFAYRKLLEECGLPVTSAPGGPSGNPRFQNGRPANGGNPGSRSGSAYPSGLGRGGYRQNNHGNSGYRPEPNYPSAQEMAMNSMMNSMQAFQLGQGMANQGGLSPIVIPNQSFGQMLQGSPAQPPMSPTPTLGSFATPHASMMSPNSDPFNPFASPSQLPRSNAINFGNPARDEAPPFQLSPSFGGLGMQPADGPGVGGGPGYYPFVNPQDGFNRTGGAK